MKSSNTKRTTKRYIERTLSVSKLIKIIPEEILNQLAKDTGVDHQVKRLHGALMFRLFLFSILKSERLSTHLMEFFYNSSEFKAFSDKGGHKTRHSSIADRLKSIDYKYFEQIFELVGERLEKHFRKKTKQVSKILKFDSSLVTVSVALAGYGIDIGKRGVKNQGKNKVKFTVGLKDEITTDIHFHKEKSYASEDLALGEAITQSSQSLENIVVFDRGLQKRKVFDEFSKTGISFVTRANTYIKYELDKVHKNIKGRNTDTLILEEDLIVYLFDHYNKKIDIPIRLIKAKRKADNKPIYFLTNIKDIPARHITDIYRRRWEIEVFFRFLKQELNFSKLLSYNENGIKVMMYMTLIAAMMILIYKKVNKIEGYKIAKLSFIDELQMEITKEIVIACGGDPALMKKRYDVD